MKLSTLSEINTETAIFKFGKIGAFRISEAVVRRFSAKEVFLNISQNSHENACARVSFLNKVTVLMPAALLKERL